MIFGDYFVEEYHRLLKEKSEAIKDWIASGAAVSMDEYKGAVGKLLAYQDSIRLLRECYAHFFETKTIYSRRDENGDEIKFEN